MQPVKIITQSLFPQESLVSLEQVIPVKFAAEIRKCWDDPEDIVDIGGNESILPFGRVYLKGKEHFVEIMRKVWVDKKRRSDPTKYIEQFWELMDKASKEESAYFA